MADDLITRIRAAQVHVGEQIVLQHLRERGLLDEPDPDAKPVDWFCDQCKVIVPLKQRCRHCGKTESDAA